MCEPPPPIAHLYLYTNTHPRTSCWLSSSGDENHAGFSSSQRSLNAIFIYKYTARDPNMQERRVGQNVVQIFRRYVRIYLKKYHCGKKKGFLLFFPQRWVAQNECRFLTDTIISFFLSFFFFKWITLQVGYILARDESRQMRGCSLLPLILCHLMFFYVCELC